MYITRVALHFLDSRPRVSKLLDSGQPWPPNLRFLQVTRMFTMGFPSFRRSQVLRTTGDQEWWLYGQIFIFRFLKLATLCHIRRPIQKMKSRITFRFFRSWGIGRLLLAMLLLLPLPLLRAPVHGRIIVGQVWGSIHIVLGSIVSSHVGVHRDACIPACSSDFDLSYYANIVMRIWRSNHLWCNAKYHAWLLVIFLSLNTCC